MTASFHIVSSLLLVIGTISGLEGTMIAETGK
jgi:hypothetical protein